MFKLTSLQNYVRKIGTDEWHRMDASHEYLEWLAKGNTPAPAYTPEELAEKQMADETTAQEKLIADKMRELAVAELKKEGKLPSDFKLGVMVKKP